MLTGCKGIQITNKLPECLFGFFNSYKLYGKTNEAGDRTKVFWNQTYHHFLCLNELIWSQITWHQLCHLPIYSFMWLYEDCSLYGLIRFILFNVQLNGLNQLLGWLIGLIQIIGQLIGLSQMFGRLSGSYQSKKQLIGLIQALTWLFDLNLFKSQLFGYIQRSGWLSVLQQSEIQLLGLSQLFEGLIGLNQTCGWFNGLNQTKFQINGLIKIIGWIIGLNLTIHLLFDLKLYKALGQLNETNQMLGWNGGILQYQSQLKKPNKMQAQLIELNQFRKWLIDLNQLLKWSYELIELEQLHDWFLGYIQFKYHQIHIKLSDPNQHVVWLIGLSQSQLQLNGLMQMLDGLSQKYHG